MDADDISLPDRLKIEYNYLNSNQNVFLVGSGAILISEKGEEIGKFNPITDIDKIKNILPYKNCLYHPTIMFKNDKKTYYREKMKYCEDYDLYLRLLTQNKKILNLDKKLVKYRVNYDSITRTKLFDQKIFSYYAQKFYWERIKFGSDNYSNFKTENILTKNVCSLFIRTTILAKIIFKKLIRAPVIYSKSINFFNQK